MKNTGMVRKVDELGRVVIPIELRRNLGIRERDAMEIYVHGTQIILKKHSETCVFCGSGTDVEERLGQPVCMKCFKQLRK